MDALIDIVEPIPGIPVVRVGGCSQLLLQFSRVSWSIPRLMSCTGQYKAVLILVNAHLYKDLLPRHGYCVRNGIFSQGLQRAT